MSSGLMTRGMVEEVPDVIPVPQENFVIEMDGGLEVTISVETSLNITVEVE